LFAVLSIIAEPNGAVGLDSVAGRIHLRVSCSVGNRPLAGRLRLDVAVELGDENVLRFSDPVVGVDRSVAAIEQVEGSGIFLASPIFASILLTSVQTAVEVVVVGSIGLRYEGLLELPISSVKLQLQLEFGLFLTGLLPVGKGRWELNLRCIKQIDRVEKGAKLSPRPS